jgi:hypothetical protein
MPEYGGDLCCGGRGRGWVISGWLQRRFRSFSLISLISLLFGVFGHFGQKHPKMAILGYSGDLGDLGVPGVPGRGRFDGLALGGPLQVGSGV